MERKKNIRNKWLHLRLDEAEHQQLINQFNSTTERHLSQYARKILLGKPMIKMVKDTGLQDIQAVLFKMQKDLNGIGNNYNQMLHRLHLSDTCSEVRIWVKKYEIEKKTLFEAIKTIKEYLGKTSQKWLQ